MSDQVLTISHTGDVGFMDFARKPEDPALTIAADGGQPLLVIHYDGSVTGAIEDAGPAAEIFVREMAAMLRTAGMALPVKT